MLSFLSPKRARLDSSSASASTAPHTPSTSTPLSPSFPSSPASTPSSYSPQDTSKDQLELHPGIDHNLWPVLGQGAPTWTTDLGLTPPVPARVRMSSARSRTELAREIQSTEKFGGTDRLGIRGGGGEMARAPLRRSRSDSSAGSSAFGTTNGARYSSWSPHPANSPAALSVDSFPSSLRSQTFGGAVEHSSEARSHAASSEGGGPSSYASASPTPRSISTRYSDGGRESHRTRRSSPRVGPGSAFGGGLRSGDGSGDEVERLGSSEDRPFGEKSWEYRVAEALFLQSPSRTPTNSTVPPSRKVRSRAPSPPSPSPRNPLRQTSAAPASWTAAANDRDDDDSDSSDSNSSWHDAEEAVDGENPSQPTTLFTVRPANRAAVAFGSEKTSEKAGARLTRGYLSPSPHLTPTHVIDLADADPFLDIPLGDDASSFVTDDEQDVVIPFLIAPIKSSVPASYRQSPPNFLSASPRELRRSWKREQRLSIRTARVPSPILEARPSVEERGTRNSPRFPEGEDSHLVTSIPPSLLSSAPSRLPSLPTCFDPLRLIPLGAWLFGFGFLFPPLWWIGAFVPRRRTRSRGGGATRLEEVTVHKSPGAALMEWPDWRLGARRPYFEGARPAGRISRILEGDRELWRGEFGWQGSQKSVRVWRQRNRVMALSSFVLVGLVLGLGIWSTQKQ